MKFIKFFALTLFLTTVILFTACNKDSIIEPVSIQTEGATTRDELAALSSNHGRYIHNGEEIPFSSVDLSDDNIEVYAGFTTQEDELLVFFNDNEVELWLNTLPESVKEILVQRLSKKQEVLL